VRELLHRLAKGHDDVLGAIAEAVAGVEGAAQRLGHVTSTLGHYRAARPRLEERIASAGLPLRRLIEGGIQRLLRIETAFTSTGIAGDNPRAVLQELADAGDPGMWLEVTSIVRELSWRMREIERTSLLRAGLLSAADQQAMQEVVTRLT